MFERCWTLQKKTAAKQESKHKDKGEERRGDKKPLMERRNKNDKKRMNERRYPSDGDGEEEEEEEEEEVGGERGWSGGKKVFRGPRTPEASGGYYCYCVVVCRCVVTVWLCVVAVWLCVVAVF